MLLNEDQVFNLLDGYGLKRDEARVFLKLIKSGTMTALSLSHALKYPRTRIYRILDALISNGLVRQRTETRGFVFEVVSYKDLERIEEDKRQSISLMKKTMPLIYDQITALDEMGSKSRILQYSGNDGLRQVAWNTLRAKEELLIFECADVSVFLNLDYDYMESIRSGYVDRGVFVKELTNDQLFKAWTDNEVFVKKYWDSRFIDSKTMEFEFEFFIYNDVFVIYNNRDEVFALEIYNQDLADMQRQMFKFIWNKAKKMLIGERGEGRLGRS